MVAGKRVGKEWVDIPDGTDLPAGLDIEIDWQTHKKRVRLSSRAHPVKSALVPVGPPSDNQQRAEDVEINPLPQRKWQRVYNAKHKTIIDEALDSLNSSEPEKAAEALAYLEEHAGMVDVGAGLVRSPYFDRLLLVLTGEKEKAERRLAAAEIVFACVQNNPVAIEGILETKALEVLVTQMGVESDGIVIRRILSTLNAVVRGDSSGAALLQLARQQTVLALSHISTKFLSDTQIMDRILVLLVGLVEVRMGSYAEHGSALNLMENVLRNRKKPYSDWMLHAYLPFCASNPAYLAAKPGLTAFCKELNANPIDGSIIQ